MNQTAEQRLAQRIALVGTGATSRPHVEKSARKEDHPVPNRLDYGNRHAQGAHKKARIALWLHENR